MWKICLEVTITSEDASGDSVHATIEETLPVGFADLETWEAHVREVGFRLLRVLFLSGLRLFERQLLASWTHRGRGCRWVRRGRLDFLLATLFGRVRIPRQRVFCTTCGVWVTPLNEALSLHEGEREHSSAGLKELACLCAAHQPYRLAQKMLGEITQDGNVLSVKQVERIAVAAGREVRKSEEAARKRAADDVVRSFQDQRCRPETFVRTCGRLYICLDGVMVRSCAGRGRWREGKVGCLYSEETGSDRRRRYVSSFEGLGVFAPRLSGEAHRMGYEHASEVILLGDGARWIRGVRPDSFPRARYVLDWYHLERKLWRAFRGLRAEGIAASLCQEVIALFWHGRRDEAWKRLQTLTQTLRKQGKGALIRREDGLEELLGYLRHNWEGVVSYAAMQEQGYHVASSLVEKAADLVVAKRQKKRNGMHWSQLGADGICALRTLWLNQDWRNHWKQTA